MIEMLLLIVKSGSILIGTCSNIKVICMNKIIIPLVSVVKSNRRDWFHFCYSLVSENLFLSLGYDRLRKKLFVGLLTAPLSWLNFKRSDRNQFFYFGQGIQQ